jgi:TolB-like protein
MALAADALNLGLPGNDTGSPSSQDGIAILPLTVRGGNQEANYLSEGIAEGLMTDMARIDDLRIVSVMNGSIQQFGKRVRINMRLTSTEDDEVLWVERYDFETTDIFDVQDKVTAAVLSALRLEDHRQERFRFGTSSVPAYEAFLRGMFAKRKDEQDGFEQAIEQFSAAIDFDPAFSRASYLMGLCYWELTVFQGQGKGFIQSAEGAFARARERERERERESGFEPEVPWMQIERKLHPDRRPSQCELADEALAIVTSKSSDWHSFEHVQIGRCLGAAGLYDGAFAFLDAYIDTCSPYSTELDAVRFEAEGLLPIIGRFNVAIERLSSRLVDLLEDHMVRLQRCLLFSRTGQYEKAGRELQLLQGSGLRNYACFYHLFWQNDLIEAQKIWTTSRRSPPANAFQVSQLRPDGQV